MTPRVGVVLPHFHGDASAALATAEAAERLGLDGVFCYDHLWPLGRPDRPALAPFPLLGAVAARSRSLCVGTLVARVGLVPDEVLVAEFEALESLAPGRIIAGLGTGDRFSVAENLAYGLEDTTAGERRLALRRCATALGARGIPVWIGDGAPATRAVAAASGTTLNLWDADPAEVRAEAARGAVTWAGPPPGPAGPELVAHHPGELAAEGEDDEQVVMAASMAALGRAGAAWVVFGPAPQLEALAAARATLG